MAEKITFTKAGLFKLIDEAPGQRRVVHDAKQPGLIADLRLGGKLSFYLYKRIHGRPARVRLGRFPEMTIEQARTQAVRMLGQVVDGKDPAAERRTARREHTLGSLFDHWLEAHAKPKKKTWAEDERIFKFFCSTWRARRLSSIAKSELQEQHAKIGKANGKVIANRWLSLLKTIFNSADNIGYRGANPARGIQKFSERSRDRFLQPAEMPAFFKSLAAELPLFQDFFLLALLTGARRSNLQAMRWADVVLASPAVWRIPETKSGVPVLVHLPETAVKILERRKEKAAGLQWVFATPSKTGHLVEPKTAWKRIIDRAGIADLRIHDLRRTLASWQAIGGASLQVIAKSLGHTSLSSTAVYARLSSQPVVESVNKATAAILAAGKPKKTRGKKTEKQTAKKKIG